jgi:hypothetical protein
MLVIQLQHQLLGRTDEFGLGCGQHLNYISSPMFIENKYICTMSIVTLLQLLVKPQSKQDMASRTR